jgi:hypothetical protein
VLSYEGYAFKLIKPQQNDVTHTSQVNAVALLLTTGNSEAVSKLSIDTERLQLKCFFNSSKCLSQCALIVLNPVVKIDFFLICFNAECLRTRGVVLHSKLTAFVDRLCKHVVSFNFHLVT